MNFENECNFFISFYFLQNPRDGQLFCLFFFVCLFLFFFDQTIFLSLLTREMSSVTTGSTSGGTFCASLVEDLRGRVEHRERLRVFFGLGSSSSEPSSRACCNNNFSRIAAFLARFCSRRPMSEIGFIPRQRRKKKVVGPWSWETVINQVASTSLTQALEQDKHDQGKKRNKQRKKIFSQAIPLFFLATMSDSQPAPSTGFLPNTTTIQSSRAALWRQVNEGTCKEKTLGEIAAKYHRECSLRPTPLAAFSNARNTRPALEEQRGASTPNPPFPGRHVHLQLALL